MDIESAKKELVLLRKALADFAYIDKMSNLDREQKLKIMSKIRNIELIAYPTDNTAEIKKRNENITRISKEKQKTFADIRNHFSNKRR